MAVSRIVFDRALPGVGRLAGIVAVPEEVAPATRLELRDQAGTMQLEGAVRLWQVAGAVQHLERPGEPRARIHLHDHGLLAGELEIIRTEQGAAIIASRPADDRHWTGVVPRVQLIGDLQRLVWAATDVATSDPTVIPLQLHRL